MNVNLVQQRGWPVPFWMGDSRVAVVMVDSLFEGVLGAVDHVLGEGDGNWGERHPLSEASSHTGPPDLTLTHPVPLVSFDTL